MLLFVFSTWAPTSAPMCALSQSLFLFAIRPPPFRLPLYFTMKNSDKTDRKRKKKRGCAASSFLFQNIRVPLFSLRGVLFASGGRKAELPEAAAEGIIIAVRVGAQGSTVEAKLTACIQQGIIHRDGDDVG